MGKNGKLLNLNSDSPKYGNKSLVTKEQENELKRRKITFSFSYFKQIPNFQIGECSKGWHIGLLERLGALGTMTPQEVLEENRGSIALRCHPIDWSAKNIPIQRKDLAYIIHSGFISGYQNRYGDNLKPPTNVYHRMTA